MKDGDVAGLAALQKNYGFVGVKMSGTKKSIVMVNASSGSYVEVANVSVSQSRVYLKLNCDYTNRTDKATFYYSLDGTKWTAIGNTLQMSYTIPQFIGYRFALFNYSTKVAGGFVDFDYFRIPGIGDPNATTPTPTATPKPTGTPTPTVTPTTPPTTTTGNIQVKMFNGSTSILSNTISPKLFLINTGSTAINLSNVKMRYYYTSDGEQAQNFWCDWSTIGASNVTGKAVKMTTAKTNANYYLELGFTSTAGSLNPGSSIELQGRLCKTDWSNYTQTNDYSFNSIASSYTASNKVTAFIDNSLKFGIEP